MPTLSVIVPVYNCAPFLEQCLKSILNQTFSDFELLIINDGSTDRSQAVYECFSKVDKRIQVFEQEHLGPSAARNLGIDIACGKYVTFVDADDYIHAHMFERLICIMEQENCDIVLSGMYLEKSILGRSKITELPLIDSGRIMNDIKDIRKICQLFEQSTINGPCGKLYRTSIIKEQKLRMPEDVYLGEDLYFNVLYLIHSKTIYVTKERFYYYVHRKTESLTKKYIEDMYLMLDKVHDVVLHYFIDKLQVDKEHLDKIYYFTVYYAYNSFINLFYENCPMNRIEKRKYIRAVINSETFLLKLSKAHKPGIKYQFMKYLLRKEILPCIYFTSWMKYMLKHYYDYVIFILSASKFKKISYKIAMESIEVNQNEIH